MWLLSPLIRFPFFDANIDVESVEMSNSPGRVTSELNSYFDAPKMFAFSEEVAELTMWMRAMPSDWYSFFFFQFYFCNFYWRRRVFRISVKKINSKYQLHLGEETGDHIVMSFTSKHTILQYKCVASFSPHTCKQQSWQWEYISWNAEKIQLREASERTSIDNIINSWITHRTIHGKKETDTTVIEQRPKSIKWNSFKDDCEVHAHHGDTECATTDEQWRVMTLHRRFDADAKRRDIMMYVCLICR